MVLDSRCIPLLKLQHTSAVLQPQQHSPMTANKSKFGISLSAPHVNGRTVSHQLHITAEALSPGTELCDTFQLQNSPLFPSGLTLECQPSGSSISASVGSCGITAIHRFVWALFMTAAAAQSASGDVVSVASCVVFWACCSSLEEEASWIAAEARAAGSRDCRCTVGTQQFTSSACLWQYHWGFWQYCCRSLG
jgi:hypothetical protein